MKRRPVLLMLALALLPGARPVLAQREGPITSVVPSPSEFSLVVGDTAVSELALEGPKGALDPARHKELFARAQDAGLVRSEIRQGRLVLTALKKGHTIVRIAAGDVTGWVDVDIADRAGQGSAPSPPPPSAASTSISSLVAADSLVTLLPGESYRLQVTALGPDGRPVPAALKYRIFDRTIIDLDSLTGQVTGRMPGKVIVVVEGPAGAHGTFVTVRVDGSDLALDADTVHLTPPGGDSLHVIAPSLGRRRYRGQVDWTSADESIAQVDPASGQVIARAPGVAEIRAKAGGKDLRAVARVYPWPQLIMPPEDSGRTLNLPVKSFRKAVLAATTTKGDTLYAVPARWTVGDTTIAVYDPVKGLLTGRRVGVTAISVDLLLHGAKLKSGYRWPVHVVGGAIGVGAVRRGYRIGDRDTLRAVLLDSLGRPTPEQIEVTWSSSPDAVMKDDGAGVFEAVSPGRAVLTARSAWDSTATIAALVAPDIVFPVAGRAADGHAFASLNGMDAHGQNLKPLAASDAIDAQPAISPDRTRIAFRRTGIRDGVTDIWVMDIDGANQLNLTADTLRESGPAWSGDSRRIYYVSTRGRTPQVFVVDLDGSHVRAVTPADVAAQDPTLSPDGTILVYAALRGEKYALVVQRLGQDGLAAGAPEALAATPEDQKMPRFAARSGELFYVLQPRSDKLRTLMGYRFDTRTFRTETRLPPDVLDYAVSPDGQQILVRAGRTDPKTKKQVSGLFWLEGRTNSLATETPFYAGDAGEAGTPAFAP